MILKKRFYKEPKKSTIFHKDKRPISAVYHTGLMEAPVHLGDVLIAPGVFTLPLLFVITIFGRFHGLRCHARRPSTRTSHFGTSRVESFHSRGTSRTCFSSHFLFRVRASVWRCLCPRLSTTGEDSLFEVVSPQIHPIMTSPEI